MSNARNTVKFGAFAAVMLTMTASLFAIFGQYRDGDTADYSAVFTNASGLKSGDSVRVAGLRVGTVRSVRLRSDATVVVAFDTDTEVGLTTGTHASVRYLNLVGDRYLELDNAAGTSEPLARGAQIPRARTQPALDLDLLLGGLKPVIRGLDPKDVNVLTAALLDIFQGQGDTMDSLMRRTSSFTNTLADNSAAMDRLLDNLDKVTAALRDESGRFSDALDRVERFTTELAADRDRIGTAIESLSTGTASIAELLTDIRNPLRDTVSELNRLAPLIDEDKELLEVALQRAPENYRKLVRVGSYGGFINYYLCGLSVRVTDLQGRTAVFPWLKQPNGRCAEP